MKLHAVFVCVRRFKKRVLIEQLENFLEEIHLKANSMNHLDGFWALHLSYLKDSAHICTIYVIFGLVCLQSLSVLKLILSMRT